MWLILLFLLILQSVGDHEPPIAGQPSGFGGAVGDFRLFTTSAEPMEVQAEDPVRFTVRIQCVGEWREPPPRPKLQTLPEFNQAFAISDEAGTDALGTWTFTYVLRPVNAEVTHIPALRFDYYRPGIVPPEKGYQTRYSDPIPLTVLPRRMLEARDIQAAPVPAIPESVYQVVESPAVRLEETQNGTPLESSAESILELAEAAFQSGLDMRDQPIAAKAQFAVAADHYRTLQQRGHSSAGLLLNLGNASLLTDDLPHAILAYRRGLRGSPNNHQLRDNLKYARSRVTPQRPYRFGWQTSLINLKRILVWTALVGLLAAHILMGHWFLRRTPWSCRLGVVAIVIFVVAWVGWGLVQRRITHENRQPFAVIIADGVQLRTGDGPLYPLAGEQIFNRGTEALMVFQRGDWLQIELPQGGIGWVMAGNVVVG